MLDQCFIKQFGPDNWTEYNISQKYYIIDKCVKDICSTLRLPAIPISFTSPGEKAYGSYSVYTNCINLNPDEFNKDPMSGYKILTTLFHECRHYEQCKTKQFDLSIGLTDDINYYLDMPEYDAHIYEYLVCDDQLSDVIENSSFNKYYQNALAKYFANFADSLSTMKIIGDIDINIYKKLFLEKFIDKKEKIYSDDFLKAYNIFLDREKVQEIYDKYVAPHRDEMFKMYEPLIQKKAEFEFEGNCITQKFYLDEYEILLKQKKGILKLEIENPDDKDMPLLQCFIKDDTITCCLEFPFNIKTDIDLSKMTEIAKVVIKQYEIYNHCTVENVVIGDSFAANPVRKLDDSITNSIDFSSITKNLKEFNDSLKGTQTKFFTQAYNNYCENEYDTPVQERNGSLKRLYYELATENININKER